MSNGSGNYIGYDAYGCSRTSASTILAYNLNIRPIAVDASYNSVRYYGRPLRCRAAQGSKLI